MFIYIQTHTTITWVSLFLMKDLIFWRIKKNSRFQDQEEEELREREREIKRKLLLSDFRVLIYSLDLFFLSFFERLCVCDEIVNLKETCCESIKAIKIRNL